MTAAPVPQNHLYDGWFYRVLIDPSLAGIRRRISKLVPPGSRVLDVGCGTGDQLRHLAGQIEYGLGIELSQTMVSTATQVSSQMNLDQCEFQLGDAAHLDHLQDQSFDLAMCSMMIHEMPMEKRLPVLLEMKRLGRRVIVVDWIFPQPSRWRNWGTHLIEYLAGRKHYAGFKTFMETGGMPPLLTAAGLGILETQITTKGTIQLWVCQS